MARPHALSKSRYTAGLQCPKLLWWRVHEPDAPELVPDASLQATFDRGTQVGVRARTAVPGGVLVDRPWDDFAGKLAATQAALAGGAPAIYEASLLAESVFVAVDILAREGSAWRVIEVKSSLDVKPEHLPDAAVQVWTLRRAGLDVRAADVMVLNRDCAFPDLSNLFRREDVTAEVEALQDEVGEQVRAQLAMLAGPLPAAEIGPRCAAPYECPFRARCWPVLPEHHVSTLYYLKRAAPDLERAGIVTIDQLTDADVRRLGLKLGAPADRQRRAVQAGRLLVEGDLAGALRAFEHPLAYLDFETINPPIPAWNGCHPYEQVPVQFSCHRERADGTFEHVDWLADGAGDPRPEIARRVVAACAGARRVVAYNAGFEKGCLERLARAVPGEARALRDVIARLVDPLPVVREHVYHPDFGGSFSIKSVLPALVPELGYDDLTIADGDTASRVLVELTLGPGPTETDERARLRAALLAYCERDTLAMVRVMARLRELAAQG